MEDGEPLSVDKLCSADRPSIYAAGIAVAHCLKKGDFAVLGKDALGRVIIMPPSTYEIKAKCVVPDSDLDLLPEEKALEVMVREERSEEAMLAYLQRRGSTDAG